MGGESEDIRDNARLRRKVNICWTWCEVKYSVEQIEMVSVCEMFRRRVRDDK